MKEHFCPRYLFSALRADCANGQAAAPANLALTGLSFDVVTAVDKWDLCPISAGTLKAAGMTKAGRLPSPVMIVICDG
jgi:hypothetical protein